MKALSTQISPSELSANKQGLIIIGCGDYSLIKSYAKETDSKYPIYADPSQKLFKIFGLAKTLNQGTKPDYIPFGFWGGFKPFFAAVRRAGLSALKAGDPKQVGGEYSYFNCKCLQ